MEKQMRSRSSDFHHTSEELNVSKMKAVFIVLAIAATCGAHHSPDRAHLSKEQSTKVQEYSMACIAESGVNPELIIKSKKGEFADDPALKKFLLCFLKKAGVVSEDGTFQEEVALAKLPGGVDKTKVKAALDSCKDEKGTDEADKVFQIFKCYYNATPTHVMF